MGALQKILINKRKELGLSLRKAGKLIGISHSYLDTLEKGVDPRTNSPIKPTPETLLLISKAYDLDYNELMIATGYIQRETMKIYKTEQTIEDTLNYYRSLQLSELILSLSPESQKEIKKLIELYKIKDMQDRNQSKNSSKTSEE